MKRLGLISGIISVFVSVVQLRAYDLEQDYSTNANPAGVWSYGWKGTVAGAFNVFTYHGYTGEGLDFWLKNASGPASVYHNPRSNTVASFAPGEVWFGPGYEGNPDNFSAIRFTAPSAGAYNVQATVRPFVASGAGDTDFHVVKNGSEVYGVALAGNAAPNTYSNVLALAAGDTVDFFVGRGADNHEAGSALKIKAHVTLAEPTRECAPTPSGLVAWWPFNGNAEDVVGTNDGTLIGGPVFVSGEVGQALQFDYADDAVRIPASPALDVGQGAGFTIEGWIKPDDLTVQHPLVEWNNDAGVIGTHFWTTQVGFDGKISSLFANIVDVNRVGHGIRTAPDLLTTDRFHHVALTYDKASGVASIYINGSRVAQENLGTFTPLTGTHLYVGLRSSGPAAGNRFAGKVDELGLYNRALSDSELQAIYAAADLGKCPPPPPCVPPPANLVAWWPFDGSAEDVAGDNDGTLLGNPAFTSGKVRQALQFDYSDDAVRVPANPALNVGAGNGFTIEGWIKPDELTLQHPIVEWNDDAGNIGTHFWTSHLGFDNKIASLIGNIVDVTGVSHGIRTAPDLLTTDRFYHVALTYDKPSGIAAIYIDGSRVAETNIGTLTPQTSSHFYVGLRSSGTAAGNRFAGKIDELSLYSRALSASELQAVFAAGSSGKCKPAAVAPTITRQPESKSVLAGGSATFSVAASGTQPLSYQWLHNNAPIAGATQSALTIHNVQASDAGGYKVVVSNPAGSVTSDEAVLTIVEPTHCVEPPNGLVAWWPFDGTGEDVAGDNDGTLLGDPVFTAGRVGQAMQFDYSNDAMRVPANASLNVGQGAGFTLEGWIKPDDLTVQHPIVEWNNDAGGIGTHFWTSQMGFDGKISSLFANIIDVNGLGHGIRTDPDVLTTDRFYHVALTYDKASGVASIFVDGSRAAQENLGTFTPQTTSHFYVGVRSSGTAAGNRFAGKIDELSLYSRALSSAELQAIYTAGSFGKCKPAPVPPTITRQPQSQTVPAGGTATFSVTASGSQPLTYQWLRNDSPLPGATQSSLTLREVQSSQAGRYKVVVSNSAGNATSDEAVLTVIEPTACAPAPNGLVAWWPLDGTAEDFADSNDGTLLGDPAFAAGRVGQALQFDYVDDAMRVPANSSLNVGQGAGFTIEGWIKSDELTVQHPIVEWNDDAGGIGTHFWTTQMGFDGKISSLFANIIDVSGVGHGIRTDANLLTTDRFYHVALTYDKSSGVASIYIDGSRVAQETLGTFTPQTSSHFYVGLRSSGTAAGNRFAGKIDELSLYNRALTDSELQGIYAAGGLGKCKPTSRLRIVTQPQSQTVNAGDNAQFSVVAAGEGPLSYQWRFNGRPIPGANSSTLVLERVQPSQAGNYSVVVSNPQRSVTSANAILSVLSAPDGHYSLESDYSTTHNPAGSWSYGWKGTVDGVFNLFTYHGYTAEGLDFWLKDARGPASVYHNPRTNTVSGFAPGAVWFGPGYEGNPDNFAAIRFTVPPAGSGNYRVESIVQPFISDAGDTDFHVVKNGTELFNVSLTGYAPPTAFSNTLALAAGDTIDFLVGRGADGRESGSALRIKAFVSLVDSSPTGEAQIVLSPQVTFSADQTHPFVIAPDGEQAAITLRGSVPSYNGSEPLTFTWFANGDPHPFAQGQVVTTTAGVGAHTVTLVVSGAISARGSLTFEVITPSEAVAAILHVLEALDLPKQKERPLAAALVAPIKAFEKGDLNRGIRELQAFQEKVIKSIQGRYPVEAAVLVHAAQEIIDAVPVDEDGHGHHGDDHGDSR